MRRSDLDRARIEANLHTDEIMSIEEWAKCRAIPIECWPLQRAARGWLELAIGRAVDRALSTGQARSHSAALRIVCGAFGLDGDSVRRRWERHRKTGDTVSLTSPSIPVGCKA
jgi:hypothetical protein